jgi:hypothetical protein
LEWGLCGLHWLRAAAGDVYVMYLRRNGSCDQWWMALHERRHDDDRGVVRSGRRVGSDVHDGGVMSGGHGAGCRWVVLPDGVSCGWGVGARSGG